MDDKPSPKSLLQRIAACKNVYNTLSSEKTSKCTVYFQTQKKLFSYDQENIKSENKGFVSKVEF